MPETEKPKLNWLVAGLVIAFIAAIDLTMLVLDFLLVGLVLNWLIIFVALLTVSLWLMINGLMTPWRGVALWQLLITGFVPFAMTTTISIMLARIIAQEKLGGLAPVLDKK
jgi:hypothetical protein